MSKRKENGPITHWYIHLLPDPEPLMAYNNAIGIIREHSPTSRKDIQAHLHGCCPQVCSFSMMRRLKQKTTITILSMSLMLS
jgi:hypothetical protein